MEQPSRQSPKITIAGLLLSLSPIAWLITSVLHPTTIQNLALWRVCSCSISLVFALLGAGFIFTRRPWIAWICTTLSLLSGIASIYASFIPHPGLSLLVFCGAIWLMGYLFPSGKAKVSAEKTPHPLSELTQGSLIGHSLVWLVMLAADWSFASPQVATFFVLSALPPLISALALIVLEARLGRWRWSQITVVILLMTSLLSGWFVHHVWFEVTGLIAAFAGLFRTYLPSERSRYTDPWELLFNHPQRLLISTFLLLCLAGLVGLSMSFSTPPGASLSLIDTLFTAVSASCVTGLIVVDTPHAFTWSGQLVILALIQAGGLGIMTFSTAAMRLLGQKLSLRHEGAVARLLSSEDRSAVYSSTRLIITFTVIAEISGALILSAAFFYDGDSLGMALWRGVFTSISAFCNAGFALQTSSLVPYATQPIVLHTVALLIIIGGLSPVVVLAIPRFLHRQQRVSVQTRIVLMTTAILLVFTFSMFLFSEWTGSLGHLNTFDRLTNAWFQSVTLRTAGFNSIDLSTIQPTTYITSLLMMFIGGSPGGTAGGVKTTTFALLLLSIPGAIRGTKTLNIFRFSIARDSRDNAVSITVAAATLAFLGLLALLLTQPTGLRATAFEVISALGTVGITIGATGELDTVGKIIITLCMFIGRVGPLSIFLFMSRPQESQAIKRPDAPIEVG